MAALWKSIFAGAAGGLAASFVMNQFQALISAATTPHAEEHQPKPEEKGDDATVEAAKAISGKIFDHPLREDEKKWAGPAVHYGLGTTLGAIYGALADRVPGVSAGAGTLYGAAVWLSADEMAVPALGLSGPPSETPASGHAMALASHLVFGIVTSATRRILLRD